MTFDLKIIRSKRKTVAIVVKPGGEVIVRAPMRVSQRFIDRVVHEREAWIIEAVAKQKLRILTKAKRYDDGELFFVLGEEYALRIVDEYFRTLRFNDGQFTLSRYHVQKGKQLFTQWYRQYALAVCTERIAVLGAAMGMKPMRVRVFYGTSQWGSCNHKGVIALNWRLIMAPQWVIDYVIVHELAHMSHMNHSRTFWLLVAKFFPRHKEAKKWLKENGKTLDV